MVVCLVALAIFVLVSGLDDLFVALVRLFDRREFVPWPNEAELDSAPERPIAVFVPLWHEHRVIAQMLERNLSAVQYGNLQFFVGVYPNDGFTRRAVADIASRYSNIHIVLVAHDGPTSKGDCLNWIYRGMVAHEQQHGVRFEVVVTHDAEDFMHAISLRLINWFSRSYDMVQLPVLPISTGADWTHGVYCDEFSEFQSKDIPVRQRLGGFLPSNGVGAGFVREALDRLAAMGGGRIFDPENLTEDYEIGYRLHLLGCRQLFVPVRFDVAGPIATREYFPRRLRTAVRQRSRWVAGIALQGWQRHGWRAPWKQLYWFWRDRKGLAGNLISLAANPLFLYGLAGGLTSGAAEWLRWLCAGTLGISAMHIAMRMHFAARIYGLRHAALVPLRMPWGNIVNGSATVAALYQFCSASLRRSKLAWRKTDHMFLSAPESNNGRPRLGEVLVSRHWISAVEVGAALKQKPAGLRLGEYLIHKGMLTEDNLYLALSLQTGIPLGLPKLHEVNALAIRSLPAAILRRWSVLPFRVSVGQLHLLTCEVPSVEMTREIAALSRLDLQFRLVRPRELDALARRYQLTLH